MTNEPICIGIECGKPLLQTLGKESNDEVGVLIVFCRECGHPYWVEPIPPIPPSH
ncbi:MAG: hypothetical protein ACFFDI_29480 [Promethearchaeota archaeon]